MSFIIPPPPRFDFWATVYSHGWCALPPFSVDKEERTLGLVVPDGYDGNVCVTLRDAKGKLTFSVDPGIKVSPDRIAGISASISSILRLDESFDSFHAEAKRYPRYRWVINRGAGRLLRCPTVFEDVVKMICTTNCSWALTEIMVRGLVTKLGQHVRGGVQMFPSPEAIALRSEAYLRKEIRCGYRAPFLLELSRKISNGTLQIEQWRNSELPSEELFKQVRTIKGVGEYAAGNILKLLGRYDYLGLDSWGRTKFYENFKNGRKVKDTTILKHYAPFGAWRGLFMWMDMTKDWHTKKYPF
jgi:3-methyladenine DNA glycosylase/8-oxoguanine DNA glycosylase